jgi:hypothetical protein
LLKKHLVSSLCFHQMGKSCAATQWCLKVLYDLIGEGNKEFPSAKYCFTPEGPKEPGTF